MNKTRVSRSEGVIEAILEWLEEGGTLTSICEAPGMPSIRAVQKWQRNEDELDEKVLRAWIRGLRIRHDRNADKEAQVGDGHGELRGIRAFRLPGDAEERQGLPHLIVDAG